MLSSSADRGRYAPGAGSVITNGLPVASQSYATAEMSVMHASAKSHCQP